MDCYGIRKRRGNELKEFRKELKLTQVELSKLSGITQTTISKIERGAIGWNIDTEIIYFNTLVIYSQNG